MRTGLPRSFAVIASALLLAACTHGAGRPGGDGAAATFVVVRHAEKLADGSRDPALTAAGRARAAALAAQLADAPLVAVYATGYRRTQATAAPAARLHGLPVTSYDARQPAAAFAASLRNAHPAGTVLVVGHSNTAPAIAAALCGCEVAPMSEADYGRRLIVQIGDDGDVTLIDAPVARP
jgi:broad specificity phosphatase PhoE